MSGAFEKDVLRGMIVKGKLRDAMAYLKQFPETEKLYQKGVELYEKEKYRTYDVSTELNAILLAYQKYYRDVFYLGMPAEEAEQRLRERLAELPIEEIQAAARELFAESSREIAEKYR